MLKNCIWFLIIHKKSVQKGTYIYIYQSLRFINPKIMRLKKSSNCHKSFGGSIINLKIITQQEFKTTHIFQPRWWRIFFFHKHRKSFSFLFWCILLKLISTSLTLFIRISRKKIKIFFFFFIFCSHKYKY